MVPGLSAARKFKSYVGLKGSERNFRQLLRDFRFIDISTAEKMIDWEKVRNISILRIRHATEIKKSFVVIIG